MTREEARQTNLELDVLQNERAKGFDEAAHMIRMQCHEDPGIVSGPNGPKVHDTLLSIARRLEQYAVRLRKQLV